MARALAQHLAAPGPLQAGPITAIAHYFNLDGDVGREERALDLDLIHALAQVHAVYAADR